jgi:hypothetical protein
MSTTQCVAYALQLHGWQSGVYLDLMPFETLATERPHAS